MMNWFKNFPNTLIRILDLYYQGSLSHRRPKIGGLEYFSYALRAAKSFKACCCKNNRIELALINPLQARINVASDGNNLQIRANSLNLNSPSNTCCPNNSGSPP